MTSARSRPQFESRPADVAKLFDKLPPHALEAECALLGAMILDSQIIGDVVQVINSQDDFYKPAHGAIYQVLIDLYDHNQPVDLVHLHQKLSDLGELEQIGGLDYLLSLPESVPSAASGPYYAKIVRDKALLRGLIQATSEILHNAYQSADPVGNQLDIAEQAIFKLAQGRSTAEATAIKQLLQDAYQRLETHDGRSLLGIETGFFELDEMTSGLQNGDMVILAARPSMGKCLSADAEIVQADGSIRTMAQLYAQRQARLMTLGDDWQFGWTEPSAYVDDGIKPVYQVVTRLGRRIKTTLTHPFLTVSGWRRLEELHVGDPIAVPRRIEAFGSQRIGEHRARLLGYLLGDGGLTNACPRFTNNNATVREDFIDAAARFGGLTVSQTDSGGTRAVSLSVAADHRQTRESRERFARGMRHILARRGARRRLAQAVNVSPATVTNWAAGRTVPDQTTFERICAVLEMPADELASGDIALARTNTPNALARWLDDLGIMGLGAVGKFIPDVVFTLCRDELALVLNRLFACDGWATVLSSGQAQLGYASSSEKMARQVQHLLLRFGVVASLRQKRVKYQSEFRIAWQIDITDSHAIRQFVGQIGIFSKEGAIERVMEALDGRRYQTNCDLIPREIWSRIDAARNGRSWRTIAMAMGKGENHNFHVGRRAPTRDSLYRFGLALDAPDLCQMADSDVYWDRIESIEFVGMEQVYDLTIPVTHNFIANDICVHNTALALNIAEHVAANTRQPVAVFSLEMGKEQLAERLMASRSGVDSHRIRRRMLSSDDFARLHETCAELSEAPLFIDDTPGLSVLPLRAKARRLAQQHHIKLIVIDYLQLMSNPGSESRQQEVSVISRSIKELARELKVPVICLSQLNRAAESREGHRPRMSDLRESGSIEQDADVIMMLHREEYYHSDPDWAAEHPELLGVAELIIAKQRNGPTGTVKLQFNGQTTRFNNLASGSHVPGGYGE